MAKQIIFALLLFSACSDSYAKVRLPQNLTKQEQEKALRVLGFGTNSKLLTDPFPLGGYAGFEAAIESHTITVDKLSKLGNTVAEQDYFTYYTITVGKGLYNNLDIFVHFMPFSEGTGISEYGGILRWGTYQLAYYPISFNLTLNVNSTNINDLIITKNYGLDFTTGITSQNIFVYTGLGWTQSEADFIGGPNGVTTSGEDEQVHINDYHYLFGAGFRVEYLFFVLQMDAYDDPIYSAKIGFRY